MSKNLNHAHGGDLDAIQRNYGIPKEEIIDFSGNINPLGFPSAATEALNKLMEIEDGDFERNIIISYNLNKIDNGNVIEFYEFMKDFCENRRYIAQN